MKHFCLDRLLPKTCLLCHQLCTTPISICVACQSLIPKFSDKSLDEHYFHQQVFDGQVFDQLENTLWREIRCLSSYQSPIKELILSGKFNNNLAALKALGQLFALQFNRGEIDPELVLIPVPLHQNRYISRGYNQAYEIAKVMAKDLKLKINNQCIIRTQEAKTQHFLSRNQRIKNSKELFKVIASVPDKVAVIDDIFTTGSTMQSICSCLKASGACLIEVWIIARTLKPTSGILKITKLKKNNKN
jgi:ComF family protein